MGPAHLAAQEILIDRKKPQTLLLIMPNPPMHIHTYTLYLPVCVVLRCYVVKSFQKFIRFSGRACGSAPSAA